MLSFLTESTREFTETPTVGGFVNEKNKNTFDDIFTEAYNQMLSNNVDIMVDVNQIIKNKGILQAYKDALLGELYNESQQMLADGDGEYGTHSHLYEQVSDMFDNCVEDFMRESTTVPQLLPIKAVDFPILIKQQLKLATKDIIQTEVTKTPIIKKAPMKRPPLPSATLLQSNINSNLNSRTASPYTPAKKDNAEIPTNHALFNFDDDDFDLDFDFEKKDKKPDIDDDIPSALVVDKPETIEAEIVNEKEPEFTSKPQHQDKGQNSNNKKDNQQKNRQQDNQTPAPIKESHTPVLDVLNQKGYDVIPSAIIKNTTIDYVAVSKNQLILCLVDKEIGDWLADEEKFNDEEPLWFSESSHRISPVRKVDIARDILKTKLAVGDMNFEIVSYVIIQSGNIINAEDMFEIWNNMNINVTRINRGSPKEIRLFSKSLDNCEEKTDKNTFEKLKKLIRSLA